LVDGFCSFNAAIIGTHRATKDANEPSRVANAHVHPVHLPDRDDPGCGGDQLRMSGSFFLLRLGAKNAAPPATPPHSNAQDKNRMLIL